jgi:hypothetical protein
MIEDLKKLLPRKKEAEHNNNWWTIRAQEGYNKALAEVHASLPSLVEYIYADLRENVKKLNILYIKMEKGREDDGVFVRIKDIEELLTPNK